MKELGNIILLGLLCSIMTGIAGCDEAVAVRDWVNSTNQLRVDAVAAKSATPYKAAQHQAFRSYFSEIEQMAVRLTQDHDFSGKFNKAIGTIDLKDACAKVFMERTDWQIILKNCTKNHLFICSDEVKYYPDLVAGFRKQLLPELQKKFDGIPACKNALQSI